MKKLSAPLLLSCLAVAAVARAEPLAVAAEEPGEPRGRVEGSLAVDFLHAGSSQPGPGGGTPESGAARELGLSARLRARELHGRLRLDVDYRGREPLGGDFEDSALRLLYRAELAYELVEDLLVLGLGRFVAPSATYLPIDGLRAELRLEDFVITPYGGRRAITTSRENAALDTFLPAAGLDLAYVHPRVTAAVNASFSRDVFPLGGAGEEYDALALLARVSARPIDLLRLGGELSFTQRASYVLGPTWADAAVTAEATGLTHVVAYAELRPLEWLRASYEFRRQAAATLRAGLDRGAGLDAALASDPDFMDHRLKVALRPLELGWVRAEARLRFRPDRAERRFGGSLDLDELGLPGLYASGTFFFEDVEHDDPTIDLDRLVWSAALGYRVGGFEIEAGASDVDRASSPLSSRIFDRANPGRAAVNEDLAPFVLGAQRIAFARAYYASERWFAGLDFEQNLFDTSEQRIFAQLGGRLEAEW